MGKAVAFLTLRAHTGIHAGAGQDVGIVDLPIQRERATNFPLVRAPSLKGALRQAAQESDLSGDQIAALFGPGRVVRVLAGFPRGLLGVLVLAAGVELARVGESVNTDARDLREGEDEGFDGYKLRVLDERERKERWMVMLVTVAALLAFRNDAVGFAAGLIWHWGFKATRRMEARSSGGWSWRRGIRTERGSVDEEGAGLLGRTSDESMT